MYQKHAPSDGAKSLRKILNILRNCGKWNQKAYPQLPRCMFPMVQQPTGTVRQVAYGCYPCRSEKPAFFFLQFLHCFISLIFFILSFAKVPLWTVRTFKLQPLFHSKWSLRGDIFLLIFKHLKKALDKYWGNFCHGIAPVKMFSSYACFEFTKDSEHLRAFVHRNLLTFGSFSP